MKAKKGLKRIKAKRDFELYEQIKRSCILKTLLPVLTGYPRDCEFRRNNIYYDSKARPVDHMLSFNELALVFMGIELSNFNCFPLRLSWSSWYVTTDFKILCQYILGHQ